MLTKCPGCDTTFRVTSAQLKARGGKVRCGQCSHVFNALDTLNDDRPPLPNPLPQGEREQLAVAPPADISPESIFDNAETGETSANFTPSPPVATEGSPRGREGWGEGVEMEQTSITEPSPLTDYLADSPSQEPAQPTRRWPWVIASIVAVAALLAQGIYFYRVEIAVLRPDLRPLLQAACKPFACDVPRPRSIDTLSIEASDLRPDLQQPGHLTLTATLRSKALYAQEWPLLELTLTDVADRKLAVKDFAARDYLPKANGDKGDKNFSAALAGGFPANGEIAVSMPLEVGDLSAAGYRLYIFYP